MKKRTSIIIGLIMMVVILGAQVPQKFNYQAVLRNSQHALLAKQDVGFRMSVLTGSADGSSVYSETHRVTTSPLGVADLMIGEGSVISGDFQEIHWGDGIYYLKVEVDPSGGSTYNHLGTSQLISVPYALYSGNISSPIRNFTIQEESGHPADSALFEVRNAEGQTVFAVYPEGTRVYILDENSKGTKSGFAVGGYRRSTKGETNEYMRITPDSIRLYVDEAATKGVKGGFAVGGYRRSTKGPVDHYFMIKPDSAKFQLVSETPEGAINNSLTVSTRSRTGAESTISRNLFNLSQRNYFIGHRAGSSNTLGYHNCFFGYESGLQNTSGFGNVFMGQSAGLENTEGDNNVFIGVDAGMANTTGDLNTSVGFQAGYGTTTGNYNSIFGFWAGYENEGGELNTYFGAHSGHMLRNGTSNTFIGAYSGSDTPSGINNTFVGMRAGSWVSSDRNTAIGANAGSSDNGGDNVFIGNGSGIVNTGTQNTFIGSGSGSQGVNGSYNVFMGSNTGVHHNEGDNNIFIGTGSGEGNESGNNNVLIGTRSGWNNLGNDNVIIGFEAGAHSQGHNNIFIGNKAGMFSNASETLVVSNHEGDSASSLIWGKFDQGVLRFNNRVGIGRYPGDNALEIQGNAYKTDGSANWEITSDVRVKTGIRTIEGALDKIMQLRPVSYRYTDEWQNANPEIQEREYYHFVAQEFAEVFPEWVHQGPETLEDDPENLLRMDSQPAQVVAIRAIQELADQNRKQQEIIEDLVQKVTALEEELKSER